MNYHFIQQEDWNDCGLACLAMLIENYHQKRISLSQLKNNLNSISGLGLSFFDLIEIGKKYQLKGEGFNCEMEMLSQNAHLCPMILNVQNEQGISHYLILNKIVGNEFYLNDPSQNKPMIKLSFAQLKLVFLNKILIFKKIGRWKSKLNFIFFHEWWKQFYLHLLLLVFFSLLANFFWLLSSSFIKTFSLWIVEKQINWWQLGVFITFVFLACFFDFCQDYYSWILSQKTWNQLLNQFFNQRPKKGIEERILQRNLTVLAENLAFVQLFWKLIIKSLMGAIFIPILEVWISQINSLFCFLPVLWVSMILFGKILVKKKIPDQKSKLKYHSQVYQQSLNYYFNAFQTIQNRGLKSVFDQKIQIQTIKVQTINTKIYHFQILINFWEKFWVKIFYFILLVLVYFSLQIKSFNEGDLLYLIILSNYLLSLLNQGADSWLDFFLSKDQQQWLKNEAENYRANNVSFKKVREMSFKNLIISNETEEILTINQKFTASFFVQGEEKMVENFFQLISGFSTTLNCIKINHQNWNDFENEFFILKKNSELLPGTLAENLFNWSSNLDSKLFSTLSPLSWLEKYQIDFSQQNSVPNLNFQQKQLVNFLASFFSFSKIFIFQNCLSELLKTDQEKLLKLFFELKPDSFVILTAQNLTLERSFCQKLVLNPMI